MSDFFHFHTTLHHLTLLYVTLHCSTLLRASSSTKNLSVWLDMPSNSYSPCSFIAANLPHPTGSVSRSKHVTWSLARRCPMRVQFWSPCRKRKSKWLPKQSIQRQLHVSARGKWFKKPEVPRRQRRIGWDRQNQIKVEWALQMFIWV